MTRKSKLFQHLVGYETDRDEYQKGKINAILADGGLKVICLVSIFLLVSFCRDAYRQQYTLGTILVMIAQLFYSGYVTYNLRKANILQTEVDDEAEYQAVLWQLKVRMIFSGIEFTLTMFLLNAYVLPMLFNEALLIDWRLLLAWGIDGILFGSSLYFLKKSQVTIVSEV